MEATLPKPKKKPVAQPAPAPPPVIEDRSPEKAAIRQVLPPLPKPNWEFWGQMRMVKLVQAVMLSLDIGPAEPVLLARGPNWEFGYPNQVGFRLMIATNHLGPAGPLKPRDSGGSVLDRLPFQPHLFASVLLTEFAEFALARGWDLPPAFPRPTPTTTAPQDTSIYDFKPRRTKGAPWTEGERVDAKELVDRLGIKEASRQFGVTAEALRQQLRKLDTPTRRASWISV